MGKGTFEEFTIYRDGEPDISAEAELLGRSETIVDTGRSVELALYRTKSGKLICSRIHHTQWEGERDSYEAKVVEKNEDVIKFFGYAAFAKELYQEAEIDATQKIS